MERDEPSDYPRETLTHELFEAQVARTPERTALRVGATTSLLCRVGQARHPHRAGAAFPRACGRGQRVGLCVERGADMLAAVLGILKAGAAYVPLDPLFPPDRLRFMAEDAQLAVLVSTTALAAPSGFPAIANCCWMPMPRSSLSAPDTRLPVDADSVRNPRTRPM